MGCDIHMYVEYKKKNIDESEKWINGDHFIMNPYFDGVDIYEKQFKRLELHGGRNYQLFSTLCGVRDYTNKVIPVSEEKGLPKDASDFVKEESQEWDGDGHSHSWLTLKELKEYQDKNPIIYYTGLLSPEDVVKFDKDGLFPSSWCQGTNQEGYERREWEEKNEVLLPLIEKLQKRAHSLLQYDWQEYNTQNDERVRIVFWFDN